MSVVSFPTPQDDMVLACDCGCANFMILSRGDFQCISCRSILTDDISGFDYSQVVKPSDKPAKSITQEATVNLALARVLGRVKLGETAAVVVMNNSGLTSVWSVGADDKAAVDWFQERVDNLMEQLT